MGPVERCAASVFAFLILLPVSGFGQAWAPEKGTGSFAISYQNLFIRNHLDSQGRRLNRGRVWADGMSQDFEYGLTDKVAMNLSLPYITAKYKGAFPHVNPGNTDDGNYHGAFQDFRFGLRYRLRMRPLVITPFVEEIIPSHGYEIFAHTAVGLGLREFRVGTNLGRRLNPILPKAYFQTQYSYAVVQGIFDIHPNRSRVNSEFGYFLTRRLSLSALESLQITHSGLRFPEDFPKAIQTPTDPIWHHHDQLSRENFLNLGLGGFFAVTESVDFFASAVTTVWGENGVMALHSGLSFGVAWNFRTSRFERQALANKP